MQLFGGPIDKVVPLATISSIADVATGTGIWIEAAQEKLKEIPSKHPRCYYGFDISDAQFPQHLDNVAFVIQDVLKPFSAQHLSRYDLVHVRLLCGALKEQDYNVVAANMMSLLKPGGYLQWIEIETDSLLEDMEGEKSGRTKFEELLEPFHDYKRIFGLSGAAQKAVREACEGVGFVNISSHASGMLQQPHLRSRMPGYWLETFSSMMPRILEKMRNVPLSTATNMATEWLSELQNLFNEGCLLGGTFHRITCQKPLVLREKTPGE